MKLWMIPPAVAAAAGLSASAGPLDMDLVAEGTLWIVHVDVEAFTDSTLGKLVFEEGSRFDIDLDELDEIKRELGIDPRRDLKSVTAYGAGEDLEDGVIVLVTNERADEALERLAEHEDVDVRKTEIDGHTVHVLRDGDERHYISLHRAGRDRRIVVISEDRRSLVQAIDVVTGREPSLSMADSPFADIGPSRDSIVYVAAGDLDELGDLEPASEILRLSEGFAIDVAEIDGELRAAATVSAATRENAENIIAVLQGMIAMGRLIAQNEEEMEPLKVLADSLDVSSRGRRITVSLRYDSRELFETLSELEDGGYDRDRDRDDDDDDDDKPRRRINMDDF